MSEAAKKSWKREKIRHLKRRNFKIGAGKQNELELNSVRPNFSVRFGSSVKSAVR